MSHNSGEIHPDSGAEQTLLHDAEADHSEGDDRSLSQRKQLIPRRWISEIEWTNSIQGDPLVRRRRPSDVSIFRVPNFLKNTKREDYVPRSVSLGPLHHGSAELPPVGHHKGTALRRMMKRCKGNIPNNMDFANRAMDEILQLEDDIRDSYEENIDCNGETLARMLTLDGCFLLELLRTMGNDKLSLAEAENCYDPIFGKKKLDHAAKDVRNDILILENQIPLIVLRKLLQLEFNPAVNVRGRLFDVLMKGILYLLPFHTKIIDREQWLWPRPDEEQVQVHLLGFLHTVIVSPPSSRQDKCVHLSKCSIPIDCCGSQCIRMLQDKNKARNHCIPHAVELINAGIKLNPCDGGILEIKFEPNSATIFLPPIIITDETEFLFRNLIAFEMCKPLETNYVACYASLMDELIDTEHDVALLRRMGILTNWLGSDTEVSHLFNCLCKGVTVSEKDVFDELRKEVNAHYKNKIKVQFAEFVRDHFSSPWKGLALVGSVVILLLTTLQTIYTVK